MEGVAMNQDVAEPTPPPHAQVDSSFWSGKRVLVTGHTGFKGGWLALWLSSLGSEVHGYALPPPTRPSFFEAVGLTDVLASHVIGDVRDEEGLQSRYAEVLPDVVFHLAAQSLVLESLRNPTETFSSNVMGTVNLLDAVRRHRSPQAVVVVTSDKCYHNHDWPWGYRESDRLGGVDPYSASKAAAELVCASYRASFLGEPGGAALCTARAGNVIGGGDWSADRLVPDAMRAFSAGESLLVRNPMSRRPWQHVLEALRGYLVLAEAACLGSLGTGRAFNFGPSDADTVPVETLAGWLGEAWPGGKWEPASAAPEPHRESGLLKLDTSLAAQMLGWRPRLGLEDGVRLTVEWYQAYYSATAAEPLRALTLDQVAATQRMRD